MRTTHNFCTLQEAVGQSERCPGQHVRSGPMRAVRSTASAATSRPTRSSPATSSTFAPRPQASRVGVRSGCSLGPTVHRTNEPSGERALRGRIASADTPGDRGTGCPRAVHRCGSSVRRRRPWCWMQRLGREEEWLPVQLPLDDSPSPGRFLIVAVGGSMLIAALLALVRSPAAFPAALHRRTAAADLPVCSYRDPGVPRATSRDAGHHLRRDWSLVGTAWAPRLTANHSSPLRACKHLP